METKEFSLNECFNTGIQEIIKERRLTKAAFDSMAGLDQSDMSRQIGKKKWDKPQIYWDYMLRI